MRNNADSAVYQSEKMLRDLGDKVPADVKAEIEPKIAALKTAMGGRDVADIKHKTEELGQSMQKIGEKMYQQQPGGATPHSWRGTRRRTATTARWLGHGGRRVPGSERINQ